MSGIRRATTRGLRSAFVLSCVALQLGSVAHVALVRHEICAEHGETVDVASDHGHSHPPASASESGTAVPKSGAIRTSDRDADAHADHQHCTLACERRQLPIVGAAISVAKAPSSFVSVIDAQRERPATSIDVLMLAPKGSPPA